MIYFDHNATAPLHPVARQAWLEASEKFIGNPSSLHRFGSRADVALEEARTKVASIIGCQSREIIFTSGATEANNQILHHFATTLGADETISISAIEHPSVVESAEHHFGRRVRLIPVTSTGAIDLDGLEKQLKQHRPDLVAVMAANNVTGVLQPWKEIAHLCSSVEVPYFCDAVQWLGKEPGTGLSTCDFVSGCAHKIGGPRGIGFLKFSSDSQFQPLLFGGPQEDTRRAGTENVSGALAMAAIFELRQKQLTDRCAREQTRERFIKRLVAEIPGTEIVGDSQDRLWNTVAAILPEIECPQRWMVKLDKLGFAVSTGSACSSGKSDPSPALLAMGYAPEKADRMLRFSSGWETTEQDWLGLLDGIKTAAIQLGVAVAD